MIRAAILSLIAVQTAAAEDRPQVLLCGGVEPFWSLELTSEAALYTDPDTGEIDYTIPDERIAEGRHWPRVMTLLAARDTAIAVLRPAACSDTMSDRSLDWSIDLLTQRRGEAVVYTGCCRAPD